MAYITINKQKFFNNLDIIAQKTKSKDKIALVLKDNAYGHGVTLIAKLAKEYGITKAVVQNTQEALEIQTYFPYILILAPETYPQKTNFCYTINSLDEISTIPKNTQVALKVDTGMHRNGICFEQLDEALLRIAQQQLKLESIFSHHRSADELNSHWYWQEQNFQHFIKKAKQLLQTYNFHNVSFHMDNSASLFRRERFSYDMARIGIAAYGALSSVFAPASLKPILTLYAKKISTRKLHPLEGVGYNATFIASETLTISTYDIGYGDGFMRILSNNYQTPQGYQQIGNISMDNSSFICEDEEIIIFDNPIEVAKKAHTIPYEILTNLKPYLKRSII